MKTWILGDLFLHFTKRVIEVTRFKNIRCYVTNSSLISMFLRFRTGYGWMIPRWKSPSLNKYVIGILQSQDWLPGRCDLILPTYFVLQVPCRASWFPLLLWRRSCVKPTMLCSHLGPRRNWPTSSWALEALTTKPWPPLLTDLTGGRSAGFVLPSCFRRRVMLHMRESEQRRFRPWCNLCWKNPGREMQLTSRAACMVWMPTTWPGCSSSRGNQLALSLSLSLVNRVLSWTKFSKICSDVLIHCPSSTAIVTRAGNYL